MKHLIVASTLLLVGLGLTGCGISRTIAESACSNGGQSLVGRYCVYEVEAGVTQRLASLTGSFQPEEATVPQ